MKSFILITALLTGFQANSQHSVFVSDAETMVNDILIGSSSISVQNIQFSGYEGAIGGFSGPAVNIPFQYALVLTTGNVYSVQGPNNNDNAGGQNNSGATSSPLAAAPGLVDLYDISKLEFDFVATGDTLSLEYIFGTEEYEDPYSSYNDVFGIFLTGPNVTNVNIARFPNSLDIISSNTLFHWNNSSNSVSNGDPDYTPYNTDPNYIQYNNFTKPLKAKAVVIPGETYHLEIAIGDGGDYLFDSGVLVKGYNLTAGMNTNALEAQIQIYPNPATENLAIELPDLLTNSTIRIKDSYGNTVLDFKSEKTSVVSFSELASGIYFIEVISNLGTFTKKVTKV